MTRLGGRSAAACVVAALVVASCRQPASIEERAACEAPSGTEPICAGCQRSHCCDALAACRANAPCEGAQGCLAACSSDDHQCRAECRQHHPTGFREGLAALASCSAAACVDSCGEGWGYAFQSTKCAQCGAACAAEHAACAASRDCLALVYCAWPCLDAACRGDCERLYPDGVELARGFGSCLAETCGEGCARGGPKPPNWSCLDNPPPTSGSGPPVTITLKITVWMNGGPVGDGVVRGCSNAQSAADCEQSPLASAPLGANGLAVLPQLPHGFDGYIWIVPADTETLWPGIRPVAVPIVESGERAESLVSKSLTFPLVGSIDWTRGGLTVQAFDCAGKEAPGVSFALTGGDGDTLPFYGISGAVAGSVTDATGRGGFLNVPPGAVEVTGLRRDTMGCIGRTKTVSHPGTHTHVRFQPKGWCAPPPQR